MVNESVAAAIYTASIDSNTDPCVMKVTMNNYIAAAIKAYTKRHKRR